MNQDINHPIDPVTFEVIWHRLLDTTEEMGIKYMRTSGSPVLVGAYDASTGITLPDGELVAMGPYITTQAHVLRLIVRSVLKLRSYSPGIGEGDMFICNDPYLGATHQPDVATVAPVHYGGSLQAWVGASGHWIDIGGPEPGGFNMNARTVFDEGLRIPPTRLVKSGVINEELVELIMNQIRDPLSELDLRGQIVANHTGRERILALFDEFGPHMVGGVMRQGIDHVERRLRARLRQLPEGVWREVQVLDHDGHGSNLRKIVCTVVKNSDRLTIDFTGSDPEVEGFANCAFGGLRAATLSAVCIMLAYDTAWNDGVARCVEIVAPPRTVVTAEYPTPVSMSTISAIIVTLNLVFGAISKMLLASPPHHDEAMANWCGASLGVSIIGINTRGIMTVLPESSHFAAGCGARTYRDGVDTGGIIINTTANIPSIEATESEYPVMYLFRRQLRDSGGPGRYRGGMAAGVAMCPYSAGGSLESSFSGVGGEFPNAFGLGGGLPGATARYLRFLGAGRIADLAVQGRLPSDESEIPGSERVTSINSSHTRFEETTVEYHNWQGGGGFGDPLDRHPDSVLIDVLNGAVSPEAATNIYGVVITDDELDVDATDRKRIGIRRARLDCSNRLEPDHTGYEIPCPPGSRTGVLRYGDIVEFDFDADAVSCLACGTEISKATVNFLTGCLVEETSTEEAGPTRGGDYQTEGIVLRRYYCPGCGRQLESSVATRGSPAVGFRLGGYLIR